MGDPTSASLLVTYGTAPPAPIRHCPGQPDAMLQRDSNWRSSMERTHEKPIELTEKQLDGVTGGKLGNGTLPFNPFHPVPNVKVH